MPKHGNRIRVVLADDWPEFGAVCTRLLATEFEIVEVVGSGVAALQAVERHDPDVLVVDLDMPDMSGVEVVQQLESGKSGVAIIVLAVHPDQVLADTLCKLGAAELVPKVRMVRELPRAIRDAEAHRTRL